MNEKLLEYFAFIFERQSIWYKKEILKIPSPWTEDLILQKYKFCNIYRELDRVSKAIDSQICKVEEFNQEKKLFNIIAGRVFNLDYTFTQLLGILEPSNYDNLFYEKMLDHKMSKGMTIWNSAYTVTQMKYDANYRKEKHAQFLLMFNYIAKNIGFICRGLQKSKTLREATIKLTKLPLIGDFLAGEIVQDLTYCRPWFFENQMDDNHDLCTVGPGTVKAIMETFPEAQNETSILSELIKKTWESQELYFRLLNKKYGFNWEEIYYKNANTPGLWLSINNIESAFCEKRKYDNLKEGNGRKRYYK